MDLPELHANCSACAALCCVGLALDKGDDFAIDKPAGLPCPHLEGHGCGIYEYLDEEGFAGCVRYDCEGAGQRTLALYDGVSWRDDLSVLAPMLETFRHLRTIHALLVLLETASNLPLEDDEAEEWDALMRTLCPADMTPAAAAAIAAGPAPRAVREFLRGLAHHV